MQEGSPEQCNECLQDAISKNLPPLHYSRYVEMLPCSKHGDPRILPPRLSAWLEFFNVIAPYSTAQTLDHQLISKICDDYGIPFTQAFEKLTLILNIVGTKDGNQRDGTSQTTDEGTGSKV